MEYVEVLRARRVLTWYCGIVIALGALGFALAFKDGPPQIQMAHDQNPQIPLFAVIGGTAFASVLLASFLAVCFDAEYKTTAIGWTRPISRLAIAVRFVAVDAVALLAAWAFTIVAALVPIFTLGLNKFFVSGPVPFKSIALILGAAVMWYGLVVLITTLLPGRGNAIAGVSWAYALIVPGLSQIPFPPLLHQVTVALNFINPLAYIGNLGSNGGTHSLLPGGQVEHAIAAWLIGIVALAIGLRIWSTREVPA